MIERKTLALDADLVDSIKSIAKKYGMTMSAYLRNLFREVIEVERRGMYAPLALRRASIAHILSTLNFIHLPADILVNIAGNLDTVRDIGERIGKVLRNLTLNASEILELLSSETQIAMIEESKIVLIPPTTEAQRVTREFILGLAKGMGFEILEEGDVAVIKLRR